MSNQPPQPEFDPSKPVAQISIILGNAPNGQVIVGLSAQTTQGGIVTECSDLDALALLSRVQDQILTRLAMEEAASKSVIIPAIANPLTGLKLTPN